MRLEFAEAASFGHGRSERLKRCNLHQEFFAIDRFGQVVMRTLAQPPDFVGFLPFEVQTMIGMCFVDSSRVSVRVA